MKRILILLSLFAPFLLLAQETKRVLFIGNSYTASNNLPSLIDGLANAAGDDLIYDSNTPGGQTFEGHSTNTTTLNKIKAQSWDFVVLQEQSQRPSFPPSQVANEVYPFASLLNDSIKANDKCTETLFYMTWGRENGDASNCVAYPLICTYEGMQERLRSSYLEMANDNFASVAAVGDVWKAVRELYPTYDLYTADGSHPSLLGSYLAACVFYTSIFRNSVIGNTYLAGVDSSQAYNIQTLATNMVLVDSTAIYRIGANDVVLDLGADLTECAVDSVIVYANGFYETLTWSVPNNSDSLIVYASTNVVAQASNVHECTVIDEVTISLGASIDTMITYRFCDTISYNGIVYDSTITFIDTFSTNNGCDSIVSTQLLHLTSSNVIFYTLGTPSNVEVVYLVSTIDSFIIDFNDGIGYVTGFGESSGSYTYQNSGMYLVTTYSFNECGDSAQHSVEPFFYFYYDNIKENLSTINISIFPNPTNAKLQFTASEIVSKVKVYNIQGSLVKEQVINDLNGIVEVPELNKGIYLLQVIDEEGLSKTIKFLKE